MIPLGILSVITLMLVIAFLFDAQGERRDQTLHADCGCPDS